MKTQHFLIGIIALLVAGCEPKQSTGVLGGGSSKTLSEAEVSRRVAVELMDSWGAFGPLPQFDPEYTKMQHSVISKIHGVRGFSESDDFHGDGTDWYEVELSPETATELRATLSRSPAFEKTRPMWYLHYPKAPSWWPTNWPANAQCYEKDLMFFVLPDTGTRAWLKRVRT